jgi:DGQHR domain-containing protein
MTADKLLVPGFLYQESPQIFVVSLKGRWLLERTTTSWRVKDPELGFQRSVRERRAREIALAVLDQKRNFPNAIVLATDQANLSTSEVGVLIPPGTRFLVVDGQHRLWAQKFSDYEADYACLIHTHLDERGMAKLFLEINDNQKRVPSSLRWDLVRLVQPENDPVAIAAAEIVKDLASDDESPLFQRIDLTGEQKEIALKQGSLAPEIKSLLSRKSPLREIPYEEQYSLLIGFLLALKSYDGSDWGEKQSRVYQNRTMRAFLKLLPDLILAIQRPLNEITVKNFLDYLKKIPKDSISAQELAAIQGTAGVKAIYETMKEHVLGGSN